MDIFFNHPRNRVFIQFVHCDQETGKFDLFFRMKPVKPGMEALMGKQVVVLW